MTTEPYDTIKIGNNVVFREGRLFIPSIVRDIRVTNDCRYFLLKSTLNGEEFTVSINRHHGYAYCPWRFVPAKELSDYDE